MPKKIAIAVHGGASDNSLFINKHQTEIEKGLKEAVESAYKALESGCSALDAVELAVKQLENDPHFNAGRGSALNCDGRIEMNASVMDGHTLKAGAIATVNTVKNPITLARLVMEKTNHVFLAGEGALQLALKERIIMEPESYFITPHQYEIFKQHTEETWEEIIKKPIRGTVGAVALDKHGHLAAATSTGGLNNCLPGRVGDSCIIGAGCYANQHCAISGTGEGEYLITGVIANTIALYYEQNPKLQQACDFVIHGRNKHIKHDMGIISISHTGEIACSFNSQIMKRAWLSTDCPFEIHIV